MKNNLDDDIQTETRKIFEKKKWTGTDIILPIRIVDNNSIITIILKKIDQITNIELLSWIKQVVPVTPQMADSYMKHSVLSTKEKIDLFDMITLMCSKKWLSRSEIETSDIEIKWS